MHSWSIICRVSRRCYQPVLSRLLALPLSSRSVSPKTSHNSSNIYRQFHPTSSAFAQSSGALSFSTRKKSSNMPPPGQRLPAREISKKLISAVEAISNAKAIVFTNNTNSKELAEAKTIFSSIDESPSVQEFDGKSKEITDALSLITGDRPINPAAVIFVKGDYVGDAAALRRLSDSGQLRSWLEPHEYDLCVLGGGSGGLAAAKEAAKFGKKVIVLDFVKPSPQGTSWGLGGTCVNVGCIPKKLMHQAGILGKSIEDSSHYGWQTGLKEGQKPSHNWEALRKGVQDHISSLNWGYRVELREKSVTYLNAYGTFSGPHSVKATKKSGNSQTITSDRFLVCTGLRPRFPDIPGAKDHCITSDDLFSLGYSPGKTLLVGASYVSLECAGFLKAVGFDVTVMVRSILLRGFDQDMANRVGQHMEDVEGVKFIRETVPTKIERVEPKTDSSPGLVRVTAKAQNGQVIKDTYNTVVLAIGRDATTEDLNLDSLGVQRNPKNAKLVCSPTEQSVSTPYVYAIGDVLDGRPELTPVAIHAGRMLARRMFDKSVERTDYDNVATTVFTPLEYGCCGLSEEDAIKRFGADNIEAYHGRFNPLEWTVPERVDMKHCYAKLVCRKDAGDLVVGLHYVGPNAGEVTQGFAMGLQLGASRHHFNSLIGIHPTVAENFTILNQLKEEGVELKEAGC